MTRIALALGAVTLFCFGCGFHEPAVPIGTGQYLDAPTGVVDVMPDGVFPGADEAAHACESGDFAACGRIARMLRHGAEAELESAPAGQAPVIGGHFDDAPAAAHGEEAHGEEAHGEEAHAEGEHGEEASAEGEHGEGEHGGGHGHDAGAPLPANPELAAQLFDVSCQAGWQTSCVALADMMLHGETDGSAGAAETLIAQACDLHVAEACTDLAGYYIDGTFRGGVGRAMPLLQRACGAGSRDACDELFARR